MPRLGQVSLDPRPVTVVIVCVGLVDVAVQLGATAVITFELTFHANKWITLPLQGVLYKFFAIRRTAVVVLSGRRPRGSW